MNPNSTLKSTGKIRIHSRSMGVKLVIVCGLAVFLTIPALFVRGLVDDRTKRAADVVQQISTYSGGPQTFLGPTLAIPYKGQSGALSASSARNAYFVFPVEAMSILRTATEERRRSLFKVPVFHADLSFKGAFDLTGPRTALPPGAELDWDRAEIVIGVSDPRGALSNAMLTVGAKTVALVPSEVVPDMPIRADQSARGRLALLGTKMRALANPNTRFDVTCSLRFSGAQHIGVLAWGQTTRLTLRGDWPTPGFDGGFLPIRRSVTGNGFTAEWSVPFVARGVRAEGPGDSLGGLAATELGASFVEVADPYQSVGRCLKYVLLFVGLIFLSYFILEVASNQRVHPAQYILVGLAQLIFYLLLLSLAERIGFDWAFAVGGTATVVLLSANAGWVFSSRLQAVRAMITFVPLYALIYALLRIEDYALLVGAVASFFAIAAAMYFTRGIDWYGPSPAVKDPA